MDIMLAEHCLVCCVCVCGILEMLCDVDNTQTINKNLITKLGENSSWLITSIRNTDSVYNYFK